MRRFCLVIFVLGLYHDASKASDCSSRGRYPNNDEPDCRGYTMCLPMGGAFMQYKLTCPLGSVYSYLEQQCTTSPSYKCYPTFLCNTTGYFKTSDTDCKSYISCVMGLTDIVTARWIDCPASQVFGQDGCVNETEFSCNPVEITTVAFEVTEFGSVGGENVQFLSEIPANKAGGVHLNGFVMFFVFMVKLV